MSRGYTSTGNSDLSGKEIRIGTAVEEDCSFSSFEFFSRRAYTCNVRESIFLTGNLGSGFCLGVTQLCPLKQMPDTWSSFRFLTCQRRNRASKPQSPFTQLHHVTILARVIGMPKSDLLIKMTKETKGSMHICVF